MSSTGTQAADGEQHVEADASSTPPPLLPSGDASAGAAIAGGQTVPEWTDSGDDDEFEPL